MNTESDLASFCLFTYNQENYIEEAIEGALSQTYNNLEIIISDDASTDGTQDIINEIAKNYKGPHKIIVNFNEKNLGLVRHVNKILYEICQGKFIFLGAGDDISLPLRVENTVNFYVKNPTVVATGSNLQEINHLSVNNNSQNFKIGEQAIYGLEYYLSASYQHLYGCTRTFTRELINAFPLLNSSCPTEDTPLLFRAFLLNKKVAFLDEIMVKYRIHGNNVSSPENIVLMSINAIFAQYRRDLNFALKQNYISNKEYLALKKGLKIRKNSRLKRKKIRDKVKDKIIEFLKIVLNKN
ncbi:MULTISPECIES: glycosyltransferase [unclassified Kaistella]|uniref:glycosyltransferase n=1 Tax=unclassified Kaistella TaxID=2762626 RepID=UPI0027373EE0|nr:MULTISPECIES: glycosyltransferase [unclassified Kaistella]MDP2452527.1 glycosyltransferase [Kaistella sp. SH11-4b]MDP2455435.1 glycosyltransferase [Kaistella sp. SH40-3]MDP2458339.1 glycosyltransferase [Kaistella sp. SH19-2b]